jgi:hypothetical protein
MGVNTTFTKLFNVTMGATNKGGTVDGSKKIGADEIKVVLGQMQGLVVAEVQQLGTIKV